MTMLAAAIAVVGPAHAGGRIDTDLRIELNHANGIYDASDSVIVTASPIEAYDKPLEMTVFENGIRLCTVPIGSVECPRRVYTDRRNSPVAVMLEFRPEGTTPKEPYFNVKKSDDAFRIGYVIAPEGFEPGFKAPEDLRRYWEDRFAEQYKPWWREECNKPRNEFIKSHLGAK